MFVETTGSKPDDSMMILSIAASIRRHGHTIIRPSDRSCWIVVSPCGRYRSQYFTRREAIAAAADRHSRKLPAY
jgi:hypothetical protein